MVFIERLLSVLDQSVACAGRGQDHALRDTVEMAEHCEALGYHRFWVSEHHGLPTIVGSAPEMLMAAIAARTTRIRIGSAGVMLPHYAALKVAEQFLRLAYSYTRRRASLSRHVEEENSNLSATSVCCSRSRLALL